MVDEPYFSKYLLTRGIDEPIKLLMRYFFLGEWHRCCSDLLWKNQVCEPYDEWNCEDRWALSHSQGHSSSYPFGHFLPVYYNDYSPGCCTTTISVQTSNLAPMAFFVLLWLYVSISHQVMWPWVQRPYFLRLFLYI